MAIKFYFRRIPFIAALIVAAIGIALGQWQMHRAHEKQAIEAALSAQGKMKPLELDGTVIPAMGHAEFRRVRMRGEFESRWPVYLENQPYQGRAGFYLLMPFHIAGSNMHVLVERGWLPRDAADRTRLPPLTTPEETIELEGMIVRHLPRVFQLGQAPSLRPRAILQNLDIGEFASISGMKLMPFVVEQTNDTQDNLVRDWPRPSSGIGRHLGYAFQWYGLALTAIVFFVITGFRNGKK
jgi:surfeit locus 1 family protein